MMKNEGVVVLACLATACFAQQLPRDLGPMEYYRTPRIGVMVGFIKDPEHQGYTIEEWRQDLGRNFDARALVARVKQAGAAHPIFYDKWIDGLVFHRFMRWRPSWIATVSGASATRRPTECGSGRRGPGIPLPFDPVPLPSACHHQIRGDCRVKAKPVLGGLHHEYFLKRLAV